MRRATPFSDPRPRGGRLRAPALRPLLLGTLLVGLVPAVLGCRAERTLTITTDPGEARVLLDDEVIGETPLRHEFHHYGVRRVCVSKDGHRTCTQLVKLDPPWYAVFPLDIVSEVLLPIGWKDRRRVEIDLPEGEEEFTIPGIQSVVARARILSRAGAEGIRELPPVQPRILPQVPEDPIGDALEAEERPR